MTLNRIVYGFICRKGKFGMVWDCTVVSWLGIFMFVFSPFSSELLHHQHQIGKCCKRLSYRKLSEVENLSKHGDASYNRLSSSQWRVKCVLLFLLKGQGELSLGLCLHYVWSRGRRERYYIHVIYLYFCDFSSLLCDGEWIVLILSIRVKNRSHKSFEQKSF